MRQQPRLAVRIARALWRNRIDDLGFLHSTGVARIHPDSFRRVSFVDRGSLPMEFHWAQGAEPRSGRSDGNS